MKRRLLMILVTMALVIGMVVPMALPVSAIDPDLVGWWRGEGNESDSSGYGNNGEGTPPGPAYVSGKFGQAFSFDGIDDRIRIPHDDSLDVTSAFTIEAWVNIIDNGPAVYYPIFIRGFDFANDIEVYLQMRVATKQLIVEFNDPNAPQGSTPTFDYVGFNAPPMDEWIYLAITFDGTNVKAYYNGVSQGITQYWWPAGQAMVAPPDDINQGWWFGKIYHNAFGGFNYFKGMIDEVRIWDRALTTSEIADIYAGKVSIDIKPGSFPNSINLGSNGVVPVAILGSATFDASTINPSTVELAGAGARLKGKSGNYGSLADVNGDGYIDLVVQVQTEALKLSASATNAQLTGITYYGVPIWGIDSISIVQP